MYNELLHTLGDPRLAKSTRLYSITQKQLDYAKVALFLRKTDCSGNTLLSTFNDALSSGLPTECKTSR